MELAFGLGLATIFLLLFLQLGAVVVHRLELSSAVREGARQAVVTRDESRIRQAALHATGLSSDRLSLQIHRAKGLVTVRGSYQSPIRFPLSGRVLITARTESQLTMQEEDLGQGGGGAATTGLLSR